MTVECPILSQESWVNHISGLGKIIRIRGPRQIDTPVGFQLFMEAKKLIVGQTLPRRPNAVLSWASLKLGF